MRKELTLFASVALVLAVAMFTSTFSTTAVNSGNGIVYHSDVCITEKTASGQTIYLPTANSPLALGTGSDPCGHNLFTNMGQNETRDILMGTTAANTNWIQYIGVANSTSAQAATDASLQGEYAACGVSRAAGTSAIVQTSAGNWTVAKTFTSSCNSVTVNGTGLYNSSSGNFLFAETTFTTVTLQTNDQLTVTWQIWVS